MQHLAQSWIIHGHIWSIIHNDMQVFIAEQQLLQIHITIMWCWLSCRECGACNDGILTASCATILTTRGLSLSRRLFGSRRVAVIENITEFRVGPQLV